MYLIWGGPEICYLGNSIFYILAFLNTNVAKFYLSVLNPTINLQAKDVKVLPIIVDANSKDCIREVEEQCVDYSKTDWDSYETSWDFKRHPMV